MNRTLTLLSTLSLLLAAVGAAQGARPVVVASMHPHYDLVRQITGGEAEVVRLLPIGASPHTFDPTPRDVARIAEADLVVFNGGVDEWLHNLVAASGTDAPTLELMAVLDVEAASGDDPADHHDDHHDDHAESEPTESEHTESEPTESEHAEPEHDAHEAEGEHAHEHDHSGVNPHVWLDPVLMAQAVPHLVEALAAVDPERAEVYEANGEALVADLEALHAELTEILAPVAGAPFVPFHDAWPYFTARYGLEQVVVIEPSPGREPTPSYLAETLALIESSGAPAIFNEVQLPARPAEILAEQAGVALYTLDPEGGGTSDEETYRDFMLENARTVAEALSQ